MLSALMEDQVAVLSRDDDALDTKTTRRIVLRGVVFGRSVRSSFCSIHVARLPNIEPSPLPSFAEESNTEEIDEDDVEPVLIRMQFMSDPVALRSCCRRFCKLGDLLVVVESSDTKIAWERPDDRVETGWLNPRLVVNVNSTDHAVSTVRVVQRHYWSMPECQQWQRKYLPIIAPVAGMKKGRPLDGHEDDEVQSAIDDASGKAPPLWMDHPCGENVCASHHGGGLGKRAQGECTASFLLHMMAHKNMIQRRGVEGTTAGALPDPLADPSKWAQQDVMKEGSQFWMKDTISMLNQGAGVFDVAGGSGHVSMALGMIGVRSTVVDPRENVGKLPRRDRKAFQRAMKRITLTKAKDAAPDDSATNEDDGANKNPLLYCQPVAVPFDALRAWFGAPPEGVDATFRHPDQETVSVVGKDRISACSAIVALHPDEATDAIVDTAVRLRIPFVIVPCCVFNRLFPGRRRPNRPNEPVSTYQDLVEYLIAKDTSIQKTTLPFEGANTILWSCF